MDYLTVRQNKEYAKPFLGMGSPFNATDMILKTGP
jgi:hypothetical protein